MRIGLSLSLTGGGQLSLLQQALSAIRRNGGMLLNVPDNFGLSLGPELSVYASGFASAAGITGVGATVSATSNELVITSTSADGTDRAEIPLSGLIVGRTYTATVVARRGAQGTQQTIRTWTVGTFSAVTITSTASSSYTVQFVATAESGVARVYSQDSPGAVGDSAIVTSISVREILSASVFEESTGITPVDALGDVIGLITDRSYGSSNLGPELVANGDFSAGSAGWTVPAGWVVGSGVATATATSSSLLQTGAPLTAGRSYRVEFDWTQVSGTLSVRVGAGAAVTHTTSGRKSMVLVATTAAGVEFYGGAVSGTLDNISVREVLGNHATQATASQKPVVGRVPKRLGPNLVSNGTFDSDTSWTKQTGWTISGGVAACDGSTGFLTAASPTPVLEIGKWYTAAFSLVSRTSGTVYLPYDGTGLVAPSSTTPGTYSHTFLCDSALRPMVYSQAFLGSIDNIEVREVLEWTNAISFDGTNDFLSTGITTGNEGWVCAGVTFSGAAGVNETIFANGAGSATMRGVWFLRNGSNNLRLNIGNGTALTQPVVNSLALIGSPRVVEGGWTASTAFAAVDGTEASLARSGDATPAPNPTLIGTYVSTVHPINGPMTALVYTTVFPSAADRDIIRRWIGGLQGQTL